MFMAAGAFLLTLGGALIALGAALPTVIAALEASGEQAVFLGMKINLTTPLSFEGAGLVVAPVGSAVLVWGVGSRTD